MSAWIVSQKHIRAIVTGAIRYDIIKADDAQRVGALLVAENRASVNSLYHESNAVLPYEHVRVPLDEIALLKQCACYVYQTCEHATWEQSEAYRVVEKLRAELRNVLPDGVEDSEAYDSAPWGV